ncbi:hypothetical protein P7C70_g712, partial [Phenoliferia sp. Uapishka_3]
MDSTLPASQDSVESEADTGGMLGSMDIEVEPVRVRPKREWTGEKKHAVQKQKAKSGVNPNKPYMARPSGPFAEFFDPKPDYYEEGGLRRVRPYQCVFLSAKMGMGDAELTLVLLEGLIRVNNSITTTDTILRDGDLISNLVHRHEPPVRAGPVRIIYDGRLPGNDGQTLVVEKPGSMPVHSTGRYHFNTLLSILKYDYDLPLVHTSNRLDRLTSGVMICALTVEKSKELGAWFGGLRAEEGGVKKEYVARCLGKFPDGEILVDEPLLTIDRQLGVNVVHPDGRESQTIFTRLSYHEATNTSVVNCASGFFDSPHKYLLAHYLYSQVHLQFIGYPIANDPVYQNQAAWGVNGGKGGVFGADRGGTEETRRQRREMGEKLLLEDRLGAAPPANGGDVEDSKEFVADNDSAAAVKFNKRGAIMIGLLTPEAQAAAIAKSLENDDGREAHDAPLTPEAKSALAELRIIKDASDGWARDRDAHALEMGRRAARKEKVARGEEIAPAEDEEDLVDPTSEGPESGLGFCPTCFQPELADPTPDQLFIWLHALRYTTTDWDWSSELPYWALDSWNGE